jgi:hypothetical protein
MGPVSKEHVYLMMKGCLTVFGPLCDSTTATVARTLMQLSGHSDEETDAIQVRLVSQYNRTILLQCCFRHLVEKYKTLSETRLRQIVSNAETKIPKLTSPLGGLLEREKIDTRWIQQTFEDIAKINLATLSDGAPVPLTEEDWERLQQTPIDPPEYVGQLDESHVQIVPNHAGGDCLFLSIQDAFKGEVTVQQMRIHLAQNVPDENYDLWKQFYSVGQQDRDEYLIRTYGFIRFAESPEDMRRVMLTPIYWGEEFAVKTLEKALGVQIIIILTKNSGHPPTIQHTYDCSKSERCVLLNLNQDAEHYQLIRVGGRGLFYFRDLPESFREIYNNSK